MIRSPILTTTLTAGNPATTQPCTQHTLAPSTSSGRSLAAFNAQADRAAFYGHVLALINALEPTPTGGLYRRCYRKDGTRIGSLAEWVEAVERGEVGE